MAVKMEKRIVQIEIPKEFLKDYDSDRFEDFFKRVVADIDCTGCCGNYEIETANMLKEAFQKSRCLE